MGVPLREKLAVAGYVMRRRLQRTEKFPIVLQLEPLFRCNLACAGCGKIQHPEEVLARRLSVDECVAAAEECGAPVVSIAGGEPLIHPDIHLIVQALVRRRKFVYLNTNTLLMKKKFDLFTPSVYFAWSIHLDGLRERHDLSVRRDGVFDTAVAAIREAQRRGFRVTTNTTFFAGDDANHIREALDFINDELKVDCMQVAPGYAYEKAPDQNYFLGVERTRAIFREAFGGGRRRKWRLNHTPLYLDFLEGKVDFSCTAWGIPSYSVFGWQRPCYLMSDGGYAKSYAELIQDTDWSRYGRGRHPKCANCMAHCGYEPTAVMATMTSPKEMVRAVLG
jgi:hopanoid biosynthesis associated radical SAM protein HpnH